eukprot:3594283-Amphidinium_carterae.1
MEFNHGWFVQAEGPPGKVLRPFKTLLRRQGWIQVTPHPLLPGLQSNGIDSMSIPLNSFAVTVSFL